MQDGWMVVIRTVFSVPPPVCSVLSCPVFCHPHKFKERCDVLQTTDQQAITRTYTDSKARKILNLLFTLYFFDC